LLGQLWDVVAARISLWSDPKMPDGRDYWRQKRHVARTDAWSCGGRAFRAWLTAGSRRGTRRGFPWSFVAVVGIGLVLAAFAMPLVWASTRDSCTAFETALLRRANYPVLGAQHRARWRVPIRNAEGDSAARGMVGRQIGEIEYPSLPDIIACTLLFWQVRIG
jgi:hypothetical protein